MSTHETTIQDSAVKANDDGLLNKANVLCMLIGILNTLNNGNELSEEERGFVFDLHAYTVKAGCCIYEWEDLADLYLNVYCTMKGVSTVLKNEYSDLVSRYLGLLDKAHQATKPHVVAKSKEGLEKLGFGKSKNKTE
jgi:hypothetical protein